MFMQNWSSDFQRVQIWCTWHWNLTRRSKSYQVASWWSGVQTELPEITKCSIEFHLQKHFLATFQLHLKQNPNSWDSKCPMNHGDWTIPSGDFVHQLCDSTVNYATIVQQIHGYWTDQLPPAVGQWEHLLDVPRPIKQFPGCLISCYARQNGSKLDFL